jgi:hypothetical protein
LIALPSFVLGKNFAAVWEASQRAADEVKNHSRIA